ncbi:aspartate aminotransferase family protein [Alsobacter sp. SYSU M60028]|uniref:Aspartate aminotransferase family protein n=1 Tax=Alsobacter ponti TaxID=2962936 RepID=A0ABT1LDX6_9HYPH|nr:aspartate aminotransferase family protein [Alsobacter ponti]MCP8938448.1 aspartate aminotransferase family protein [Alsobacter ponti]
MTESASRPSMSFDGSARRIEDNRRFMPGGVNSNFRLGISPTPLVFERAEGPYLYDVDGNRLIDYYLGMGPMILGHSPAALRKAVHDQIDKGILFAGQSDLETRAAQLVCELVPCAGKMRFGSSGSEVVQAAIRLARASTGRTTILKFEGHYHGWFDNILWSTAPALNAAGPEDSPVPVAGSAGQLPEAAHGVEVLVWNDLAALERRLARGDVAGVIMEAAMCNAGAIHPARGYLEGARAACTRHGTVLIFDEVITGFRLAAGGAQETFGVTPDLATFGKAIANGFPVAAIAGRADLLDLFATGGVVHGGTYNGQCISMAATVATLESLTPDLYAAIDKRGRRLMQGIAASLDRAGIRAVVTGFPGIFHVGFGLEAPARHYRDLTRLDRPAYIAFTTALLRRGVRALERGAWFLSVEHDDAVIDATLAAVDDAAREVAKSRAG